MANTLLTLDEITLEALDIFMTSCEAVKVMDQKHSKRFGNKGQQIGKSLRIRKPDPGTIRRNTTYASSDVKEEFDTLTLDKPYGSDFELTTEEMTLQINDVSDQIIKPRMHTLAANVDLDILKLMALNANHSVGTVGADPTKVATFTQAGAFLSNYAGPRGPGERHAFITADQEDLVSGSLREDFHTGAVISQQNKTAMMEGFRYGMNWHMDQSVYAMTTGSRAKTGTLVNGATQSGSSITVDALGSGKTAKAGEHVTFAAVKAINPVTKAPYAFLKQFVLTEDVAANGTVLKISPPMVLTGSHKNVSAGPADDAAVTFIGDASTATTKAILAHKQAVTIAFASLQSAEDYGAKSVMKHDPETGIGMLCAAQYDIDNHKYKHRIDILAGFLAQRPEHIIGIWGK